MHPLPRTAESHGLETGMRAPREFWISNLGGKYVVDFDEPNYIKDAKTYHVIEYRAFQDLQAQVASLRSACDKLAAALESMPQVMFESLLHCSAWMGVPEKKRIAFISEDSSNIQFIVDKALAEYQKWRKK